MTTAGAQTFGYFDTGSVASSSGPAGTSTFDINETGRMKSRTDAAGTSSFTYDPRGDLKTYTAGGTPTVTLNWTGDGNINDIAYPAGVTRTFAYDALGRVTDDKTAKAGTTLTRREYTWNADSSLDKMTLTQPGNTAAGVHQYTYDLGSRLTGVVTPAGSSTYGYDAAGNRTTVNGVVSVYDQRNRVTNVGGVAQTWAPRGTLATSGSTAYSFDGLDRLTGSGGVTYQYDSLNRVATRTQGAATSFSYAGFGSDPVSDGSAAYLRGPSGGLLGITRAGTTLLTGSDRHGDVSWTLNPSLGTVVDSVARDPWGKTLGSTGSAPATGFQGDWTDATNGLVWMAARWYQPATGTFVSRDSDSGSVGSPLTLNRFGYGIGDPLRYTDPTGYRIVPFPDGNGHDDIDDATGCTTRSWSSGTTTSWCDGGAVTTTGAGVTATLNPDGSSSRTVGGVPTDSPAPVSTGALTAATSDGGSVTCTAAATAGGYGRTCFYVRSDGGFGVVGATGFRGIGADQTLKESGPIDRREYNDLSQGTLSIAEAALYVAAGADYDDAALRFDSPSAISCYGDICLGGLAGGGTTGCASGVFSSCPINKPVVAGPCSLPSGGAVAICNPEPKRVNGCGTGSILKSCVPPQNRPKNVCGLKGNGNIVATCAPPKQPTGVTFKSVSCDKKVPTISAAKKDDTDGKTPETGDGATNTGSDGPPTTAKPTRGSGKDKASDAPSWVKNDPDGKPKPGETGGDFADRMLEGKYGEGNYPKGPGSEYSQIKKYGERSFK